MSFDGAPALRSVLANFFEHFDDDEQFEFRAARTHTAINYLKSAHGVVNGEICERRRAFAAASLGIAVINCERWRGSRQSDIRTFCDLSRRPLSAARAYNGSLFASKRRPGAAHHFGAKNARQAARRARFVREKCTKSAPFVSRAYTRSSIVETVRRIICAAAIQTHNTDMSIMWLGNVRVWRQKHGSIIDALNAERALNER